MPVNFDQLLKEAEAVLQQDTPDSAMPASDPQEDLVNSHIGLAKSMAYKFASMYRLDPDDAEQTAMVGLVKAARDFDVGRGKPFKSAAAMYIKNELRHLARWPKHKTQGDLTRVGIDDPFGEEDDATGHDVIGAADPSLSGVEMRDIHAVVQQEIAKLPKDRRELLLRWLSGESYRDIAQDYGKSFVYVGKLIQQEVTALRAKLADMGVDSPFVESVFATIAMNFIMEGRKVLQEAIPFVQFMRGETGENFWWDWFVEDESLPALADILRRAIAEVPEEIIPEAESLHVFAKESPAHDNSKTTLRLFFKKGANNDSDVYVLEVSIPGGEMAVYNVEEDYDKPIWTGDYPDTSDFAELDWQDDGEDDSEGDTYESVAEDPNYGTPKGRIKDIPSKLGIPAGWKRADARKVGSWYFNYTKERWEPTNKNTPTSAVFITRKS